MKSASFPLVSATGLLAGGIIGRAIKPIPEAALAGDSGRTGTDLQRLPATGR